MERDYDLLTSLPEEQAYALVGPQICVVGSGIAKSMAPVIRPGGLDDQDRFSQAKAWLQANLSADELAFFSFTFNPLESGSSVVVPERVQEECRLGSTISALVSEDSASDLQETPHVFNHDYAASPFSSESACAGADPEYQRWAQQVLEISSDIQAERYQKVVLARTVTKPISRDSTGLLTARLRENFPTCLVYRFNRTIGATPEILLEVQDGQLTSLVLAGSAPNTPEGRASLMASSKDILEHEYAAQSVLEKIALHCEDAQIKQSKLLLVLPNVVHIASTITGRIKNGSHPMMVLSDLHPTAAVCGTPRNVAMEKILELESVPRGAFAGPIGIIRGNGDMLAGLAIRCGEVNETGEEIRLYAGCGIMGDSDPAKEFLESELKLRAMESSLGEFVRSE